MFSYVVEEGQRVLMCRADGTMEILIGPQKVSRFRKTFRKIPHFVAHPGEFLIVRYRDGQQEHIPGPTELWFDPRVHKEILARMRCKSRPVKPSWFIVDPKKATRKSAGGS